jgi:hypothetical protein
MLCDYTSKQATVSLVPTTGTRWPIVMIELAFPGLRIGDDVPTYKIFTSNQFADAPSQGCIWCHVQAREQHTVMFPMGYH